MDISREAIRNDIQNLKQKFNQLMDDCQLQPAERVLALNDDPQTQREAVWGVLNTMRAKCDVLEDLLWSQLDDNMKKLREERS